ncbi:MAG: family 43 glycosylhydrolase [Sedimentisphaerales bacterium]|nr:family 43 glycosylhydrolase [Sedimentisphaerales bacterium]MBN2843559.1 family 43 glycosylhydrolase [Sedimentisphaerales bacterium]
MKHNSFLVKVLTILIVFSSAVLADFGTFVNPIYEGADPFVVKHTDGYYYFCQSEGDKGIAIWKSDKLTDKGIKRVVWKSPDVGWNSDEVWAPEIHYLQGRWYIYYAADSGHNRYHRVGVLQSKTQDAQGEYNDMGMVYTGDEYATQTNNRWGIDATPLEMNGKLYLIWSGWNGYDDDIQSLYIAEMSNPWTVITNRVKITDNDTYAWERVSNNPDNKGLNEGAQILRKGDKIFVIYSCSGSWEPTYKLGQLSIREGLDPMNPKNWIKKSKPVCQGTDKVLGVGHCSFTKSPDDTEDWMVYHSKISRSTGWQRNVRIEKFTWNEDGEPVFPVPSEAGTILARPSGEKLPVAGGDFSDSFDNGLWDNWCYYGYNRFIDVRDNALVLGTIPSWGIANNYRSAEKAVVRDRIWSDFVMESKVRVVSGNRDAGLIFRVNHPAVGVDAMKGYFAGIVPATGRAIAGKMDGRGWMQLAATDFESKVGQDYRLKIVAAGEKYQFLIDDVVIFEFNDSSYSTGYAGVRVLDTEVSFDDITIKASE